MDVFSYDNYKELLRDRVKTMREESPVWTLRKLAEMIPLQYTYLSKVLNDEATHLNEDHTFLVAQILDLDPHETEYFTLLRARDVCNNEMRFEYLTKKTEKLKSDRTYTVNEMAKSGVGFNHEMAYLLDPLCTITHLAVTIEPYVSDPRKLCSVLKITEEKLKSILSILEKNRFLDLQTENPLEIKKVYEDSFHFGKEHPLMRIHQHLLKSAIPPKLWQTEESKKQSYLFTFHLSDYDFELVKKDFMEFLVRTQKRVRRSQRHGVYQLNYDFFKWL